ncbi:L-2,4-diaminobutyric acid acetyltransferase [Vibrio aerogenes CECT 7868]|uniref:L-2,4-diaminobutyric acid acetyltransferase n=1 Tax=Vibrio aerogenes CECT 7868 TaxID=1216006 RepID=A0A1M5ZG53_9VIBR|nr:diaminobutyrate acetyltransferase [Vibrio aerogenes]SHI23111.1 L-2,4-diaminobutyric acid acetyltransferase [Vibrio aerogenes CECT 7868]
MRQSIVTATPWISQADIRDEEDASWRFRTPCLDDGDGIHQLIAACPPLDVNSSYCNFLQSSHFNSTCVLAERDQAVAGFISAYRKPESPDELFIWQVAVAPRFRGQGLAFRMLQNLLKRPSLCKVAVVETTITEDNQSSWALFKKLDKAHGLQGSVSTFLDENRHFKGKHDTEFLYRIPLNCSSEK